LFVEVFSHNHVERPFLVPAVAEPLIVWVISGEARVDERDPEGEWLSTHVSVGDFFLTRTPSPYEMKWEACGDMPFQVMHVYLGLPLFERLATEILGKAAPSLTLRDVSGGLMRQYLISLGLYTLSCCGLVIKALTLSRPSLKASLSILYEPV
jgi:AraC family transcriptional regulator